jgi:hypothetical protein
MPVTRTDLVTMPVVLAAGGDPGGAAALAPVLQLLDRERRVRLEVFAYAQAVDVFTSAGLTVHAVPQTATAEWFSGVFERVNPALVLVSTSCNGSDHEKRFIEGARRRGIPSVAVLDFWSNYGERFSDGEGNLRSLPDVVTAMDDAARDGLIAAGIPPRCIVVTGQPAFDSLAANRAAFSDADRAAVRARLGVGDNECVVLFVSQPLRQLYGDSALSPRYLGYDECTVFGVVARAVSRVSRESDTAVTVVFRPHPRESSDWLTLRPNPGFPLIVASDEDPRRLALASDLIVGMTSVLLVESCRLGCPVLSLQPGSRAIDVFPEPMRGCMEVVYSADDAESIVDRLLRQPGARAELRQKTTRCRIGAPASPRVVEVVSSMLVSHAMSGGGRAL